ncbi:unnamed protein product [Malus baccata var. baccata]
MAPYRALTIRASNAVVWDYRTGRPLDEPPKAIASLINGNINGHHQLLHRNTIATCYAFRKRAKERMGTRRIYVYYDRFSAGHEWLLDGWVAEMRTTQSGEHWYDPLGKQYNSKQKVLKFWEDQQRYER